MSGRRGRGRITAVDLHVSARLRERRVKVGISQERLGFDVGLTFQQIQKYEKGTNRISAGKLWRFARALRVPVGYFFTGLPAEAARA